MKKRGNPHCVPEPGEHLDLGKPDIIVNLPPHELGHLPLRAPGFGCAGRDHLDWTLGREPRAVAVSVPLDSEARTVARGPSRASTPPPDSARADAKLPPDGLGQPLANQGLIRDRLYRLGAIHQVLAKVGEALEVNPKNVGALMLAGVIHEQRGDIPKARDLYEKVLALSPRFAPAANNLTWVLSEHGGDRDRALAHLGMVSAQLGDKDAARQALSAAAASPTPFPGQDTARKALAGLKGRPTAGRSTLRGGRPGRGRGPRPGHCVLLATVTARR